MTNGLLQVAWIIDDGATFVLKAKILSSLFVSRDEKGASQRCAIHFYILFLLLLTQVPLFQVLYDLPFRTGSDTLPTVPVAPFVYCDTPPHTQLSSSLLNWLSIID